MAMFVHALKQAGCLDHLTMTVCNVGSRKIDSNDDYATQSWGVFAPNLCIYGFDADPATCEEANADLLNRDIDWVEKHVPVALNDTVGETTLYVTKHPMCSSLYAPNEELLQRFNGLSELASLDHTTRIETTTLDAYSEDNKLLPIDFLQIDVQGADLDVLKGAPSVVDNSTLAVQIEVEFEELYCGQPLFSDIDAYMRERGFKLFELHQTRQIRASSPIPRRTSAGKRLTIF